MIELYTWPTPNGIKVHILLEEIGLRYRVHGIDITTGAHANLGAITYHFGSKGALYHAAIESVAEPFVDTVAEAAKTPGNALERIEAVVRAALAHMTENASAPTMLLRELTSGGPLPAPMRNATKHSLLNRKCNSRS